jgi:hypothetical protein
MKRDTAAIIAIWMAVVALMGVGFFASLSFALPAAGKGKDGKSIFLSNPCTDCHSMTAVGIKKQAVGDDPAADEAPDLSGVGLKHTAEWITKFLLKKETLDGKKHEKKFGGNAEDLDTLAKWLESQKADKNGKK